MTAELSCGLGSLPALSSFKSEGPSVNRFNEDLTEIDREASDLEFKITETRKELEYIHSLLLKYEGIRNDLNTKLSGLENQRKNCLLKKNTLLATHNVFGSSLILDPLSVSPAASFFDVQSSMETSLTPCLSNKSNFLSKINGDESERRNLQDMVSELFSSTTTNPESSTESSSTNGSSSFSCWSTSSVDKNNLTNRAIFNSSSCSSPFGLRGESLEDPFSPVKTFSSTVSNNIRNNNNSSNNLHSPAAGIQSFSEAVGVSLNQSSTQSNQTQGNAVTPVQVTSSSNDSNSGSLSPMSNGVKDLSIDDPLDLDSSVNDSHSNNEVTNGTTTNGTPNGSSNARFILRQQTNGTQVAVGQNRPLTYNSVLALETSSNGFVYKSLADKSVCRFRFGNTKDTRSYSGHADKVKVLCLDLNHNLLYTGCDDGKVRCFNINTGTSLCELQCEGSVIGLEKGWDNNLVVATNKGWIYLLKNQLSQVISSHRVFNWICTFKPLVSMIDKDFKNKKVLLVLPMKHKPSLIDASDGKVLKELGEQVIESKPCLQVNGGICIIATTADKNDTARSVISVFDAAQVSIYL